MFEDIFLVVYGVTVFFFFIGFTVLVIRKQWDKKMIGVAGRVVEKIEMNVGHKFDLISMKLFIEISTIVLFLLPVINTLLLLKAFHGKQNVNKAITKAVKEQTKFLDD